MKEALVIYHDHCVDGWTAAWVAWLAAGDNDTEYVPASYGDPPPPVDGREVFVLDFSYPRQTMLQMAERAKKLVVLDHHKTAQAELQGLPFAHFDMQQSGAAMAWEAFQVGKRPWLVDYVEDRDLWRFALPDSKEINAWIGTCARTSFAEWSLLEHAGPVHAAHMGRAVLCYIDRYVRDMVPHARPVRLAGHTVPSVNAPYVSISELLGKLAESAPFAIGWFQRGDGLYAYSLRSRGGPEAVDVSAIAKRFGGGGHHHAAGFCLPERLPEDA